MSRKLGDLVKKARTEKGLTQAALAEKVDGLTASDVSKIERGEKEPAQDVLGQRKDCCSKDNFFQNRNCG